MPAEQQFRLWSETAGLRARIAAVQFAVGCAIALLALLARALS